MSADGRKFKVLILGGGAGGISVAARLRRHFRQGEVAIVEPSVDHFYQPLWTLVGAGLVRKEKTRRSQSSVLPSGVDWIRDAVGKVLPQKREVHTRCGYVLHYETLVVATGLEVNFDAIEGIKGNLGRNGIHSIYRYDTAEAMGEALQNFKGGRALFTMPPVPIKCAGAPQKIVYLADRLFRRNGVREKTEITFACAGKVIFGVPEFAGPLMEVAKRKNISTLFGYRLTAVDAENREATFEGMTEDGPTTVRLPYDLLHVVPPMSAHPFIRESGLAVEEGPQMGWLEVDKHTLQHPRYPEIFGIGDVTGIPNSKTGAAVRKQAPIVVANLLAQRAGKPLPASYDGYSSCPLTTDVGRVILAEFGYDGKLLPSFPLDPTKERWTMWLLKRHLLSRLYWYGMLPGRA